MSLEITHSTYYNRNRVKCKHCSKTVLIFDTPILCPNCKNMIPVCSTDMVKNKNNRFVYYSWGIEGY